MSRVSLVLLLSLCFYAAQAFKMNLQGSLNEGVQHRIRRGHIVEPVPNADAGPFWINQPVDHFSSTQQFPEWKQMYFVNSTYWGGNGSPILFMLGGESALAASSVQGHFILNEIAPKYNALIVSAEHRFYGQSLPFPDLSTAGLVYATSRQALADYAALAKYIKQAYNASGSKIVVMGGSYSGNLAAWARYVYPEVFDISWASSAPVEAKLEFKEYFQVVSQSLGPACWLQVADGSVLTHAHDKAGGSRKAQIENLFKVCSPVHGDLDLQTFLDSILDSVAGIVQYSGDNNKYQPFDIKVMCRMLTSGSTPNTLAATVLNITAFEGGNCTETSWKDTLAQVTDPRPQAQNPNAATRLWTWQTCNEFGYYQSVDTTHVHLVSLAYFQQICKDAFGIDGATNLARIHATNDYYKSKKLITQTSKTIFAHGSVDPWHALGIIENSAQSGNLVTFIKGTAHCADLYPSRAADLPSLTHARALIFAQLDQWLSA